MSRVETPPRFVLSGSIDDLFAADGEVWSAGGKHRLEALHKLLSVAKDHLSAITGNLSPDFFPRTGVLSALEEKLAQGVTIDWIFAKEGAATLAAAEDTVQRENPGIVKLKERYASQLRLFWVHNTPRLHLFVADDKHVQHEEAEQTVGEHPETLTIYDSPTYASEWARRLAAIRAKADLCQELFADAAPSQTR